MISSRFERWASRRRNMTLLLLILLSLFSVMTAARAGPGHDHGPEPASTHAAALPRVTATSETYQLVGIVEGEVLVIYLDHQADNAPVTSARLEVTIADKAHTAELQKNGTYEVTAPLLKTPGVHEVLINIVDGATTDLLVGSVKIASNSPVARAFDHSIWSHLVWPSRKTLGVMASVALVGLIGFMIARRPRDTALRLVIAGGLLCLAIAPDAGAHEGHDHGTQATALNGNAPQRLPDGNIFLPKPTQRLLEVRTRVVAPETTSKAVRFVGRIVANPNRSGVVQSTIQGRFIPAKEGVASIGARVKAGDLLGSVAPSFVSKESADLAQTLGDLDQQISIARSKLGRQEILLKSNVLSKAGTEETRLALEGLLKRRQELLASRVAPEELRAPVDGVITAVRVMAGQVVSQSDQLFSIVDPSSLMVEALVFDQLRSEQFESVIATVNEQISTRLKFVGRSRALQQQYSVLRFEVLEPNAALNVGTPVTISGRAGARVTGIILPRAAIAQAPNGQMVVFKHKEPEIFEPRAIRFEPFDAQSVLVQAGIEPGDKIVVQGAPLVNQVR